MAKDRILVVGLHDEDDRFSLSVVGWYVEKTRPDLASRIFKGDYEEFDMTKYPERGDVLDALSKDVALIVALHLMGIDEIPDGRPQRVPGPYFYNRANGALLERCMKFDILLACVGDQPWLGKQKVEKIENGIYLYSRKEDQ